ncbi:MAG: RAMP superfamily CRISPR-associated protein [Synechococcales bacterium]|nr:RAMP superfamily CRISPR-associated protein [Synechococcales bacterium]
MMKLVELTSNTTTYTLTAIVDSALCIGAGGSSGSLADKAIVRNASGQLVIPGSHLKGRLRHECEKLARALGLTVSESPNPGLMMQTRGCVISKIFGNPQQASRLLVDDLLCEAKRDELPPEVIRPGVTMNRRRGTAEDEKLYFLETSPSNQGLKFTGQLHLIQPMEDYALPLVVAGLKHIQALGGSKSAGLGWLAWELPDMPQIDATHPGWSALQQLNTQQGGQS